MCINLFKDCKVLFFENRWLKSYYIPDIDQETDDYLRNRGCDLQVQQNNGESEVQPSQPQLGKESLIEEKVYIQVIFLN